MHKHPRAGCGPAQQKCVDLEDMVSVGLDEMLSKGSPPTCFNIEKHQEMTTYLMHSPPPATDKYSSLEIGFSLCNFFYFLRLFPSALHSTSLETRTMQVHPAPTVRE